MRNLEKDRRKAEKRSERGFIKFMLRGMSKRHGTIRNMKWIKSVKLNQRQLV